MVNDAAEPRLVAPLPTPIMFKNALAPVAPIPHLIERPGKREVPLASHILGIALERIRIQKCDNLNNLFI